MYTLWTVVWRALMVADRNLRAAASFTCGVLILSNVYVFFSTRSSIRRAELRFSDTGTMGRGDEEEADLVEDLNNQVQFYDPCSGIMRSIPNVFTSKDKSKVIDDARKKIVLNILWQVDSVQLMEEEASNTNKTFSHL
uniref:Uncharacterized protein n=1 Tax=Timema douglasi TaxID=61478 RepID=A0A7R8VFR4_TIMDO|nr:unnamed protein product [Timema douglasi]